MNILEREIDLAPGSTREYYQIIMKEENSGKWPSTTVLYQTEPTNISFLATGEFSISIGQIEGKKTCKMTFKAPSEQGNYKVTFKLRTSETGSFFGLPYVYLFQVK